MGRVLGYNNLVVAFLGDLLAPPVRELAMQSLTTLVWTKAAIQVLFLAAAALPLYLWRFWVPSQG